MLKKLIVVCNARSSRYRVVEQEVLTPARKLSGWLVGKYEVKTTELHENAAELAKILNDGDLVVAAGGDGTAAMAANGVMRSGKDVTLGVLGYGNFNDLARMLKAKRAVEYGGEYVGGVTEIVERYEMGKISEIYPLEAIVDGKHWRYAPCYLSLGLFAESTAVFDEPKVREKLKTGKKHMLFSIWTLAKWYFRNRKREFLPEGKVGAFDLGQSPRKKKDKAKTEVVQAEQEREKVAKTALVEQEEEEKCTEKEAERSELAILEVEERAEKKKFKNLLKTAKKQQRLEMRVGAQRKMLVAGVQTKARLVVAGTEAKTKLLNAKLKAQDKVVNWGDKVRERHNQDGPEIIIEGAVAMERRKGEIRAGDKSSKKTVACAVEKSERLARAKSSGKRQLGLGVTDYIAINSPTVAKMMKGGRCYRRPVEFRSTTARLGSFWRLVWFMARSVLLRVPGKKTRGDVIKFKKRGDVMIQAEGEYEMLKGVKKIEVRKSGEALKVIRM